LQDVSDAAHCALRGFQVNDRVSGRILVHQINECLVGAAVDLKLDLLLDIDRHVLGRDRGVVQPDQSDARILGGPHRLLGLLDLWHASIERVGVHIEHRIERLIGLGRDLLAIVVLDRLVRRTT
jgi:hypothetical protein